MLRSIILVGAGGFLGSVFRYISGLALNQLFPHAFPAGTFFVNISGSLLIGLIFGLSEKGGMGSSELRLFLTAGFCGGFTTFSSFANENLMLLREGQITIFLFYTFLTVIIGLFAVWLGYAITKLF